MTRKPAIIIQPVNMPTVRPSEVLPVQKSDQRRWRVDSLEWEPGDQRPLQMRLFLNSLSNCPNVSQAAKDAGAPRRTVYRWKDQLPEFAQDWADAIEEGCDHLEEIAYNRAKELSDKLLIFLLKAWRPDRYRDVRVVEADLTVRAVREMTDYELESIAARGGGRIALPPPS